MKVTKTHQQGRNTELRGRDLSSHSMVASCRSLDWISSCPLEGDKLYTGESLNLMYACHGPNNKLTLNVSEKGADTELDIPWLASDLQVKSPGPL